MRSFVIDTSVAVKWFSREKETEIALLLREKTTAGEIRTLAPDLLLVELANALRHNRRFQAEDVAAAVHSLFDLGIEFFPSHPTLLKAAVESAYRHRLTVYDGLFLALAETTNSSLLTADEKLLRQTKGDAHVLPLAGFTSGGRG